MVLGAILRLFEEECDHDWELAAQVACGATPHNQYECRNCDAVKREMWSE